MSRLPRGRRLTAGLALAFSGLILGGSLAAPASAADGASIDHSEQNKGTLQLLVSVPGQDPVDLNSVAVTIDGQAVVATAKNAASTDVVRRTTVLALDTSASMKGAKIAEAKKAALAYLDTVPANVEIGLVTFDNTVQLRQAPTLDRTALRTQIAALTLKLNTALYQGVQEAITATGTAPGQRQVLILSDGQDNTKAPLQPVLDAIKKTDVKIDAVALQQGAAAPAALAAMTAAGHGTVIPADTNALQTAFSAEAGVLARQVLVSVTVPPTQKSTDANVEVNLTAAGQQYTAAAFVTVKAPAGPSAPAPAPAVVPVGKPAFSIPKPAVYAGIGAMGLGVIGLIIAMSTGGGPKKVSLEEQFEMYGATAASSQRTREQVRAQQAQSMSLADQARQAAENVLATNSGFEARIADRLEGAGMALKPSEWLLMHIGITFLAGLIGLLLSGGNPIAMVLLLVLGAIGPWVYLALKRSRRLKAFDAGLADTLQLMAGSLSAGLSLAQSMDTIVREGNEPITSEFKRAIVESRLGVPLEDALEGVAGRMQSEDFKWVVMAIRIQREVGGNLAELLMNVATTLREREYIRRHVRALSAEGRLSCWILGGLPPVFLVYLSLTKPDYVMPMYTTPLGWLMCTGMAVLLTVGIVWMSKVAKVDV